MKLFVLGAGASKAYPNSFSGLRMPIARDFFKTFNKMKNLTESSWVLVGPIINALQKLKGVASYDPFKDEFDIEEIHSLIEKKLFESVHKKNFEDTLLFSQAYSGLIFLFSTVVNDISNGPTSLPHENLVEIIDAEDVVITFNWDTLLDRALFESGKWCFENGYFVKPRAIFNNGWQKLDSSKYNSKQPLLLKMHGSANWLTGYYTMNLQTHQFEFRHNMEPDTFFVYQHSDKPYACYDGRWEKVYEPFSYGYYPPNLEEGYLKITEGHTGIILTPRSALHAPKGSGDNSGLPSMPVIIPPVKYKTYEFFGNLFDQIWDKAGKSIQQADMIIFIGYSFPSTDKKSKEIFIKSMMKRNNIPKINIIDPAPDRIKDFLIYEVGIPENMITIHKDYFSENFDLKKLI